jgi:L-ascorbate metabolism protein UlaG (beta-lactamase superfamily)
MFRMTSPKGKVIVADPWIMGNPVCTCKSESHWRDVDVVAITHGHFDHFNGIYDILKASPDVKVVAPIELARKLIFQGHENIFPIFAGGSREFFGIKFSAVPACHTSSETSNFETKAIEFRGDAIGYVIELEDGFKVYVAGDTGLTADMKFVVADYYRPDLAILPVSGITVMDPEVACYAASIIKPKYVIPCHDFPDFSEVPQEQLTEYQNFVEKFEFPKLLIGKSREFATLMKKHPEIKVVVLGIGDSQDFPF